VRPPYLAAVPMPSQVTHHFRIRVQFDLKLEVVVVQRNQDEPLSHQCRMAHYSRLVPAQSTVCDLGLASSPLEGSVEASCLGSAQRHGKLGLRSGSLIRGVKDQHHAHAGWLALLLRCRGDHGFYGDFGLGFVVPYSGPALADERLLVCGVGAEREVGEPSGDLGGLVAWDRPAELDRAIASISS
jgi:hypothetical protein